MKKRYSSGFFSKVTITNLLCAFYHNVKRLRGPSMITKSDISGQNPLSYTYSLCSFLSDFSQQCIMYWFHRERNIFVFLNFWIYIRHLEWLKITLGDLTQTKSCAYFMTDFRAEKKKTVGRNLLWTSYYHRSNGLLCGVLRHSIRCFEEF